MCPSPLRRFVRPSPAPARRKVTAWFRPRLELLEDRTLLSAGALDPGFGAGGKVVTDFKGPLSSQASALAVVNADKLVVVGNVVTVGGTEVGLARYNADGS